jgi:hypothetical protein
VAHPSQYGVTMMNKLALAALALATFAVACSTPAASSIEPDTDESEGAARAKDDDKDDKAAEDDDKPSTASSNASADAGTPAKPGKGGEEGDDDDDLPGKEPDAACMTQCQGLDKCEDKSFCEFYCVDMMDVITCLAGKTSCTKQDFIACEPQDDGEKEPAGEKGGK